MVLDSLFDSLRRLIIEEDDLNAVLRIYLVELIEARARGWKTDPDFTDYYREKIQKMGLSQVC